jgi:thymidylate synthase ThyX
MSKLFFTYENYTNEEKNILKNFFTNTDKPVFGLINLPDVVKGALFARYSRSNKSLRRLFLDEFYSGNIIISNDGSEVGLKRAIDLYDKMILEYGDDSVAQLGGAHIACEQVSNVLTKIIERSRLAAFLEQSTRYVLYDKKINDRYQYQIPPEIQSSGLYEETQKYIEYLFNTYSYSINYLLSELKNKYPLKEEQSIRAWNSIIKAKACDITRGILPGATKTNLGIYASGQTYEYLLIKMFSSSNIETLEFAGMILNELKKIIPSFLKRVDVVDRGVAWSTYIKRNNENMNKIINDDNIKPSSSENNIFVQLIDWDKDAENKLITSIIYEYSQRSYDDIYNFVEKLNDDKKFAIIKNYVGERINRRHKPGRAFETIYYTFDIKTDYGAFRDLQRHRMLTPLWQKLSPYHGYVLPSEIEEYPDLKELYISSIESVVPIYENILKNFGFELAQYIVPFAYNVRFIFKLNLREAFHMIELRTQKQGHLSYRKVCLEMFELIKLKAGHKIFAEAMKFVDQSFDYELSREDLEKNIDKKIKVKEI